MDDIKSTLPEGQKRWGITCTWKQIVFAMFLRPENNTTDIYVGNNLKILIKRSFYGEEILYDGTLMRNIGVINEEDWRVATSLTNDPCFSSLGEMDLFNKMIEMLEQLQETVISFYILSPKDKEVLVSMKFIQTKD